MAGPAEARLAASANDPAWVYVQARNASINGDYSRSAELMSRLVGARPGDSDLARKALVEAINAGRFDLAKPLLAKVPANELSGEARLMVVADALKARRYKDAEPWLIKYQDGSDLSFLLPMVKVWGAADAGDLNGALAAIAAIPATSAMNAFKSELTAFVLLKFGRTQQAEPFARRTIGGAGAREAHIRIALADAFVRAGDKPRAAIMLDGIGDEVAPVRDRILAGRAGPLAVDTGAKALSEVLTALSADLARLNRGAPVGLAQVATYANPDNSAASILLAVLLNMRDRPDNALAVLSAIAPSDPLSGQARDTRIRMLIEHDRANEALGLARADINLGGADNWARLGDVEEALGRHLEAAAAFGKAIEAERQSGRSDRLWTFYLLRASAFEAAGKWPEARADLLTGLKLSPDQPLLLNFLGYAKLERGEDLDAAEAMIAKASQLAPDNASITDSLGWAQFKRGKVDAAIATLQQAAEKDPAQAEIREHLGDALFTAGRRFEARYAWSAALVTAEDESKARVESKLKLGLTAANAAP